MISRYFLLSFILISYQTQAQVAKVLGDTTEWCIGFDMALVLQDPNTQHWTFNEQFYHTVEDTVIGSKTYKAVYTLYGNYAGALREDTLGHLFGVDVGSVTEQVLCDFNMVLGDSILLDFPASVSAVFADGYYRVDSMSFIPTPAGIRKYLRLHNPLNTQLNYHGTVSKVEWLEGVGSLQIPLYLFDQGWWGNYGMIQPVSCNPNGLIQMVINKRKDGAKEYIRTCFFQNPIGYGFQSDSCNVTYYGSVNERGDGLFNVHVYPNPSQSDVSFSMQEWTKQGTVPVVEIINLSGEVILQQDQMIKSGNTWSLPAGSLTEGLYLIKIRTENKIGIGRFVIVR